MLSGGGVIEGLQVQAASSPNMTVIVGQGSGMVPTGTYPSSWAYKILNDTTSGSPAGEALTIGTAPTSNSRIDAVVAYVNTSYTTGTTDNPGMWVLADVQGTVASTPTAPTASAIQSAVGASNPYIILAYVTVGTGVGQITSGNISDQRTFVSLASSILLPTAQLTNPVKFSVWRSASWTSTNAGAVVPFDTKEYDTGTNIDVVNNKGRFTAPVAGFYRFNASVIHPTATNVIMYMELVKNGTVVKTGPPINPTIANNGTPIEATLQLNASDYVEAWVLGGNGSAMTTGQTNAYFMGELVSRF